MNKKILFATLAGGITGFLLGWLIFGMLLTDFYKNNTVHYDGLIRDPPRIWCYAVGNLLWAWMFAYVFQNWANIKTFGRGATAAIIIAAPVIISFDLFYHASMYLMNRNCFIVDVIANVALSAIAGGVVGAVLGMGEKKAVTS